MVAGLYLCFSQYCYSDTVYGSTNNAATDGLTWGMSGVLPDYSSPNVSLQINGITYYYVMSKEPGDTATVYVRNEDLINGGYIFEEVDDWSGLPGNSIQKYFRFQGTDASQWGSGEINVIGDGTISDPSVIYLYRMDIGEDEIICTTPLTNPQCPGYLDALYKYLATLENVTVSDPYYNEWVQLQLEQEAELDKEQVDNDTSGDNKEDDLENMMKTDPNVGGLVDVELQDKILIELAAPYAIEPYYSVVIVGGNYPDSLEIKDNDIPDNNRALRQLASDAKHYSMVRSQYNENLNGE